MSIKKKKLLIIGRQTYGSTVDYWYWCKYLSTEFDITFLCFESRIFKSNDFVNLVTVSTAGNKFFRLFRFIKQCIKEIKKGCYEHIIVSYFFGCLLLPILLPKSKLVLDIRSGHISNNSFIRTCNNYFIILSAIFFSKIFIIDKALANYLNLYKTVIIPVGSEIISDTEKDFTNIHLLYTGTLDLRNIHECVYGFADFIKNSGNTTATFTIVARSNSPYYSKLLDDAIRIVDLGERIQLVRNVPHTQLKEFFDSATVGVSYIPITDYFNYQPPTKMIEYLRSGLICLATATEASKSLISGENGILIKDNREDFHRGLITVSQNAGNYRSDTIRSTAQKYAYSSIANLVKLHLTGLMDE